MDTILTSRLDRSTETHLICTLTPAALPRARNYLIEAIQAQHTVAAYQHPLDLPAKRGGRDEGDGAWNIYAKKKLGIHNIFIKSSLNHTRCVWVCPWARCHRDAFVCGCWCMFLLHPAHYRRCENMADMRIESKPCSFRLVVSVIYVCMECMQFIWWPF